MQIKNDFDKFETKKEFIDFINRGGEVEFQFLEKNYSITHSTEGICVIEQYKPKSLQIFAQVEDLFTHSIEGNKMEDILTEIQPTFRSF